MTYTDIFFLLNVVDSKDIFSRSFSDKMEPYGPQLQPRPLRSRRK